jgi:hypothetical protein
MRGFGDAEARRCSQGAGIDQHLVKPAELDKLRDLLSCAAEEKIPVSGCKPETVW